MLASVVGRAGVEIDTRTVEELERLKDPLGCNHAGSWHDRHVSVGNWNDHVHNPASCVGRWAAPGRDQLPKRPPALRARPAPHSGQRPGAGEHDDSNRRDRFRQSAAPRLPGCQPRTASGLAAVHPRSRSRDGDRALEAFRRKWAALRSGLPASSFRRRVSLVPWSCACRCARRTARSSGGAAWSSTSRSGSKPKISRRSKRAARDPRQHSGPGRDPQSVRRARTVQPCRSRVPRPLRRRSEAVEDHRCHPSRRFAVAPPGTQARGADAPAVRHRAAHAARGRHVSMVSGPGGPGRRLRRHVSLVQRSDRHPRQKDGRGCVAAKRGVSARSAAAQSHWRLALRSRNGCCRELAGDSARVRRAAW